MHIERTCHLQPTQATATVGDSVAIRMPRNLIQNGFYVAVGNAGAENSSNLNVRTVRIYFNLSPEGACAIMSAITRQLNKLGIPFTFKALYNPSSYGRYDAAVLYFERSNYEVVRQIVETVYAENHEHFYARVPLFTKLLAPGLALAEEPDRKFTVKSTEDSEARGVCTRAARRMAPQSQEFCECNRSHVRQSHSFGRRLALVLDESLLYQLAGNGTKP